MQPHTAAAHLSESKLLGQHPNLHPVLHRMLFSSKRPAGASHNPLARVSAEEGSAACARGDGGSAKTLEMFPWQLLHASLRHKIYRAVGERGTRGAPSLPPAKARCSRRH